jgi:hypothetical protein
VTRQTEQARTESLGPRTRVVGLGRHHSVELRGVTEQNADGVHRQNILRTCIVGEELRLEISRDNRDGAEPLRILRKSGEQVGFVTPHTDVAEKLGEGRKFRVKIAKLYPYRGHEGAKGAVLDFEEVNEFPIGPRRSESNTMWIVLIGIVTLLLAAAAAKLLGYL